MENGKTERFYNSKTMALAVGTVGITAYLLGNNRGMKKGYIMGLTDGLKEGIETGKLEGYVNSLADVATVIRNSQN